MILVTINHLNVIDVKEYIKQFILKYHVRMNKLIGKMIDTQCLLENL